MQGFWLASTQLPRTVQEDRLAAFCSRNADDTVCRRGGNALAILIVLYALSLYFYFILCYSDWPWFRAYPGFVLPINLLSFRR